jgi:uncharacterized OB-fold protein
MQVTECRRASGISIALASFRCQSEEEMEPALIKKSNVISLDRQTLRAVKCEKCGAKMYPKSLLAPHLTRHRRRQRWVNSELRKLQYTFAHMRDIA